MSKLKWEVIHEADDENGEPCMWAKEINHPTYGRFCWIEDDGDYFVIEIEYSKSNFKTLKTCKSLLSAKRWVTMNLI